MGNKITTGLTDGCLHRCPSTPNCVCSEYKDDTKHFTEPFIYVDTRDQAKERLLEILENDSKAKVIEAHDDYIRAEYSAMIFTDDVEFRFPKDESVVHLRSASRVGKGDLGANRRRMNKLRGQFEGS